MWEPGAADLVVDRTRGYPFFPQEYGRVIWRISRRDSIGIKEIKAAESIALEYLDENLFSQRIGKLPSGERRYMAAIASLGDGPQPTGHVAATLGKTQQELSATRDRLIRSSLIYAPRRGEVDFTVPLCADYIRRTMPEVRSIDEVLDEMREERL